MLERLRQLRFGYIPYEPDAASPGDRRRFPLVASKLELQYELYDPTHKYDVIYVTSNADLTTFHRMPHNSTKLVFEMVDSYLAVPDWDRRALVRGIGKWLLGKHSHPELSYRQTLMRMCARADLVICSTPEQKELMVAHNRNTHPILDFHEEMGSFSPARAHEEGLDLLWEGVALNTVHFRVIAGTLRKLALEFPLRLHLVTDLKYRPLNVPLLRFDTRRMLESILHPVEFYLTEWSTFGLQALASRATLGLIPLNLEDALGSAKPENKLLIMWRLGLPVVASATPAYIRTMGAYGGPRWACRTGSDWERHLRDALRQPELREQARQAGLNYAGREHGNEALLARWLKALATLV